ncbi:hypothetical protein MHU86_18112 [Fragilaria crotonensis]|nr:hypothetical protein MHU86_18112 [Fragilaria crotonensis]
MKFFATTIFIIAVGLASADIPRPQITVGLSNSGLGKFSNGRLGGLEPGLKWQTEGSTPEFDWEAGVDVSLEDINTVPYSYWAKIKRKVKGFVVSARGASDSSDLQTIDVDIRADGPSTSLQVTGTLAMDSSSPAASTYSVGKLNFRQTIGLPAGRITVSPRYNVRSSKADVGVGFARGSTSISIDTATKKVTSLKWSVIRVLLFHLSVLLAKWMFRYNAVLMTLGPLRRPSSPRSRSISSGKKDLTWPVSMLQLMVSALTRLMSASREESISKPLDRKNRGTIEYST